MTSICIITLIMLVWFKTDAFIVYCKLFKVDKFFGIPEWQKMQTEIDVSITYFQYLRMTSKDSFSSKLITCPICFIIWCSLLSSLVFDITTFPTKCIGSIILYFGICKLLN